LRSTPALEAVERWLAGPEQWLLLVGRPGTGKTVALRHALERRSDAYVRAVDLVGAVLSDARAERRIVQAQVLALDDVGREGTSEAAKRVLFSVLDARHESGRRTALSSNLGADALRAHLGEALADRVRSSCKAVALGGESMRGGR
jgi:DNA replication protein DnaC